MEWTVFFRYLFVMAGVTYLVRMLPLVLLRRSIKSPFINTFLYYVPYAVLAAMTIPDIFYSTSSVWSAVVTAMSVVCPRTEITADMEEL